MTQEISDQRQPLFISHCLSVDEELQWSLFVHNKDLDDFSVFSDIPKMLIQDSLKLLQVLNELKVCPGHPDDEIVRAKKGGMKRKDGELVDDYAPVMKLQLGRPTVECWLMLLLQGVKIIEII